MILNKTFVYVNSANRLSAESSTNGDFYYSINLPQDKKVNRVCVTEALIPKSYYLVNTTNNSFTLTELGQDIDILFPVGDYILSAFAFTLQSLLNSNSPNGWTYTITNPSTNVSQSANTGKWTITVSGNSSNQPTITVTNLFYEPFGFSSESSNVFFNDILVSTNVIKLQVEDRILLVSTVCNDPSNGALSVLQAINSQGSPDFSTISYQCEDIYGNAKEFLGTASSGYHFGLQNENGIPIKMNGLNINFTLLFFYEPPIYESINNLIKILLSEY